jgi:uncharacterized protein (UPF0297 family)
MLDNTTTVTEAPAEKSKKTFRPGDRVKILDGAHGEGTVHSRMFERFWVFRDDVQGRVLYDDHELLPLPGTPPVYLVDSAGDTASSVYAESDINATLAEREKRYGNFTGHAQITQDIKAVMQRAPKYAQLAPDQKESLEMIAHKIGRVLNGDPDYIDSWLDIGGYSTLVVRRLERDAK